jgi:hypothetical protein
MLQETRTSGGGASRLAGAGLGLALLALARATAAQLVPLGSEFQVNTYTTGTQYDLAARSVGADGAGNFVVVWSGSPGKDGSGQGVFGRRYASTGSPLGGEFQVNTYTTGYQNVPAVAVAPAGEFAVVWQSIGQDGAGSGIFGRRYASTGSPLGGEFRVNTYTTSHQSLPAVAAAGAGDLVVVWTSTGQDGSGFGVFGQRYDASGVPAGGEFRVNTYTTSYQAFPAVAAAPAGEFMVVWQSYLQDGGLQGVFGRRYDGGGSPQGAEFRVNTYTTSSQMLPAVAAADDGSFVVAWAAGGHQDGEAYGIFAQRYDGSGSAVGGEFQVNTYTTSTQIPAAVSFGAAGNFLVVWAAGAPDAGGGIAGQHFDATGAPVGGEFQVNTYTTSFQGYPSVAGGGSGRFAVAWASYLQDGSAFGVFGRRYQGPTTTSTSTTSTSSTTSSTQTSSTTTTSSSTTSTLAGGLLIPVRVALVRPGSLFKFVAKGTFTLPDRATDHPAAEGGSLSFSGTTGGQSYALDAGGWRGLGPGGDGTRGFRFRGDPCRLVLVKPKGIKAVCRTDTGDFGPLPEAGPVDIVLAIGSGTTRYCGRCGGTAVGSPETLFKRKLCDPPPECP